MLLNNVNLPIIRMPSSPKTVNWSPLPFPESQKQTPQNQIPKSPLSLLQRKIRVLNVDNSSKSNKRFSQELGRVMPDQSQSEYFRDTPSRFFHKTGLGQSSPKNSKSHFAELPQDISRTNSTKRGHLAGDIAALKKESSSRSVRGLPKPINLDGPKSVRSSIKKTDVSPGLSSRKVNISKLSGSQSSSPDNSPMGSKAKRFDHGKSQFGKGRDDSTSFRKGSSRRLLGKNKYLLGNIIRRKSCHCSDCGGISAFEKKHLNIAIPPKRASKFKDHLLIGLRKLSRYVGSSPSEGSSNSKRSSNRTISHNMEGPDAVLENTLRLEKHDSKSSSFRPEYRKQQSHSRDTSKKSIGSMPRIKERVTIKDDHHLKKLMETFHHGKSSKDLKGKSLDLMKEKANTNINLDKSESSLSEVVSSEDEDHSLDGLSVRSSSKHEKKSSDMVKTGSKTSNSSLKEKKKSSPKSHGKLVEKNEKYFETLTVMRKITESNSPGIDLGASGLTTAPAAPKDDITLLEKSESLKVKIIHRNPVKVIKKRDTFIQKQQEERSPSIEKKPTRMTTSFTSPLRKIRPQIKKRKEQSPLPRLSSPVTHSCLNLKTARLKAIEITTSEQQNMMSLTMRSPTSGKKSILDVERLYVSPAAKKLSQMKIKLGNIVMKKPLESISSRVMQTTEEGNKTKRQEESQRRLITEEGSRTKRNQEIAVENKRKIAEKKVSDEKPSASKNLNGRILEKLQTDKMMLLDIEKMMEAYDSPVKSRSHVSKKASVETEVEK